MNKLWILMTGLLAGTAVAQELPRIARVTLYPGSATVERDIALAVGSRRVQLRCLPAAFDAATLRVDAEAGVRVGDVTVEEVDAGHAQACKRGPLGDQQRALEDRRAAVAAEIEANETVIAYLRQPLPPTALGATPLAAVDQLRRTAQDAYARQQPLKRRLEDIDRELTALRADREKGAPVAWRHVAFAVAAERAATLRLSYQVTAGGWSPAYRASLESQSGRVTLERQAVIAQRSGEDWLGVRLKLSTGQPGGVLRGPTPSPWELSIQTESAPRLAMALAPAAPAPMARASPERRRDDEPLFDASVFQGSFATEFDLPGAVDLPADGQRVTVSLERLMLAAQLRRRVAPRLDTTAYLVAEAVRPEGVWPPGPLQLLRDGAFSGTLNWTPAADDGFTLPFGRDERLRVTVEKPASMSASAGFIGSRAERQLHAVYVVGSQHAEPVQLEILEAQPVSTNEDIRVQSSFSPKPTVEAWKALPGIVAWQTVLAPGSMLRFSADYTISYPKDARIRGLR
jgi:uncharacterized protein (TIGR02231 family)